MHAFCETCGKQLTNRQLELARRNKSKHFYCSSACWSRREREYNYDDKFLDEDSDLAAYFAGWFTADGHFDSISKSIHITSVDKQLLRDFFKRIRYRNYVARRKVHKKDGSIGNTQYSFAVAGNVRKRIEEMGYTPGAKTGKEFIPERFENDKWFFSFLRGFVDGDGTIRVGKRGDLQLSMISASLDIILGIREYLYCNKISRGGFIYTRKPDERHGFKRFVYLLSFGHFDSLQICQRMYANATIKLERKYDKYVIGSRYRLKKTIQKNTVCSYPGCENPAMSKGLCKKHYDKVYQVKYFNEHKQEVYERSKIWRLMNREKLLSRRRAWYLKNAEREKKRQSEWKKSHRPQVNESKRRYHAENREKENATKRAYREKNHERVREQEKESYYRNREPKLARHREYYQENREAILVQAAEYRNRPEVKERNTQYWKEYEEKNKDKRREYRRQYYLRKKAAQA